MDNTTEGFEAFYHRCIRGFHKGTPNIPKQIMVSVYTSDRYNNDSDEKLKLIVTNCCIYFFCSCRHKCRGDYKLTLRPDTGSGKTCDGYISTAGGWWAIDKLPGDDLLSCRPLITLPYRSQADLGLPPGVELPWEKIGVKKFVGVDMEPTRMRVFRRKEVQGKLMICGSFISEWLPSWFAESKYDY